MVKEEWQDVHLGSDATLKARIGWQGLTVEEYRDSGDYYLVTGTDFKGGLVNWDTCHYVDKYRYTQDRNIQLKNGDVLITKDGTIGKVGYVDNLKLPATLNSGVFVIRPKNDKIYSRYLYYIFTSSIFDEFLDKLVAGSTINHLYQKDFISFQFKVPPKQEQQAIATALSDTDELINSLEKLIAKKEVIKTGTVQELLTGKKRLDGFSGEWKEKKLGDIGDVLMCKRIFSYQTTKSALIPFYKIGTFGKEADAFISEELYSSFKKRFSFPKKGDILVSASGTIGRTIVYDGKPSYFQDSNIVWIGNDENLVTNEFLYHLLQIVKYESEGSTIQRLYNSIIKNTNFMLPSKQEQSIITTILSDIDKEIEALQTKLSKIKAIKEGMMQELLTGRTRLMQGNIHGNS